MMMKMVMLLLMMMKIMINMMITIINYNDVCNYFDVDNDYKYFDDDYNYFDVYNDDYNDDIAQAETEGEDDDVGGISALPGRRGALVPPKMLVSGKKRFCLILFYSNIIKNIYICIYFNRKYTQKNI